MNAETFVLALLAVLPDKLIRGRKRLQKLAYLALNKGAPADVKFSLHDYGPYSPEIANAAQMLTLLGDVAENEVQLGALKKFVTEYKLEGPANKFAEMLSNEVREAVVRLNSHYSTIELEIASTILYFELTWQSHADAISATKRMKPTKSENYIISKAEAALREVGLNEGRGTHQMSRSRSD
jgi:uncharacterized protein YwgA